MVPTGLRRHLNQRDHLLNVNDSSQKLYHLNWRCFFVELLWYNPSTLWIMWIMEVSTLNTC